MQWHEIHRIPAWLRLEGTFEANSPCKQGHLAQDCVSMAFSSLFTQLITGQRHHISSRVAEQDSGKVPKIHRLIFFLVPSCWLVKDCGSISGEENSSDQINPAGTWGLLALAQWNTADFSHTLAGSRNEQSKLTLTWKILLKPKQISWEELSWRHKSNRIWGSETQNQPFPWSVVYIKKSAR